MKYTVIEKISSGSHADVYRVQSNQSPPKEYALKVENQLGKERGALENEATILKIIEGEGIPEMIKFGTIIQNDEVKNVMLMPLYGPELVELEEKAYQKSFDSETVLLIGFQLLNIIEHIHSKGYSHRDLKPRKCFSTNNFNRKYIS